MQTRSRPTCCPTKRCCPPRCCCCQWPSGSARRTHRIRPLISAGCCSAAASPTTPSSNGSPKHRPCSGRPRRVPRSQCTSRDQASRTPPPQQTSSTRPTPPCTAPGGCVCARARMRESVPAPAPARPVCGPANMTLFETQPSRQATAGLQGHRRHTVLVAWRAAVDGQADLPLVPAQVLLPARPAGFGYTIEAACYGCANASAPVATLVDVGFGEVWLCSGTYGLPLGWPARRRLRLKGSARPARFQARAAGRASRPKTGDAARTEAATPRVFAASSPTRCAFRAVEHGGSSADHGRAQRVVRCRRHGQARVKTPFSASTENSKTFPNGQGVLLDPVSFATLGPVWRPCGEARVHTHKTVTSPAAVFRHRTARVLALGRYDHVRLYQTGWRMGQ